MALNELTEAAVHAAIAEFDRIGRAAFLEKYGFREARDYFVANAGKLYDSKAIAGAAHGYLPGREPLRASDFSGGRATVEHVLRTLGFEVQGPPNGAGLPTPGEVLSNEEIAQRFGVGNMGGMRRSRERNLLVLISDPFKGLYVDRWDGEVLHYTGMGRIGEQNLTSAQNRTLAEAPRTGIVLHLLEALEPQRYTYVGEVELAGEPYAEIQADEKERLRNVWMFPLRLKGVAQRPTVTESQLRTIEAVQATLAGRLSDEELARRARQANKRPCQRQASTAAFIRNAAVAEYAKRLARGQCDLCRAPAPFSHKGDPYLECHHVIWLSQGGEDTIDNAVALCPNCHRRIHILGSASDRAKLTRRVLQRLVPLPVPLVDET
jgi:5-methylcytosine-specific restriction enzyme A